MQDDLVRLHSVISILVGRGSTSTAVIHEAFVDFIVLVLIAFLKADVFIILALAVPLVQGVFVKESKAAYLRSRANVP